MSYKNLEEAIKAAGNPVTMMRNSPLGPYVYPVVASEFSNWRDEQRAWRTTAVLFHQSYHMADMFVDGPDALKLFQDHGINSFKNFPVNRAKQFIGTNPDGYVIGDAILFHLAENSLVLIGRPSIHNWVQYHAIKGKYNVQIRRDERSIARDVPIERTYYRYQIQGPLANKVLEKLNGGPFPEVKFFYMGEITIAGRKVRALRHGMAGEPGLEVWGPHGERKEIRDAIMEAGREFGIVEVGSRTYATNTLESGWIPSPMPAVYSGDNMKAYREWLPAGYESTISLAGSFVSDKVDDYYLTPYALGYGPFVKFDHDFVGSDALKKMEKTPQRKKVTLAWNGDDCTKIIGSLFQKEQLPYKLIDLPLTNYASLSYDKVMKGGKMVGLSTFSSYSFNERSMLSLAMLDPEVAQVGDELTMVWGEENGGSKKPTVERHRQIEVRVKVGPIPYSTDARATYAKGWRTGQ